MAAVTPSLTGVAGIGLARPEPRPQRAPNRLAVRVAAALGIFEGAYQLVVFTIRTVIALPRSIKYWSQTVQHIADIAIGPGAIVVGGGMFFVIASISFFTGTEVGLEGFSGLQQIGAQAFTGVISSLANTREITPLVAGVALAAQVGAGFTAQLGAMRISEEIDALEVMGVNSFVYLVATRVVAAMAAMVPLYLAALFASFLASELIVTRFFGLASGTYRYYFRLFLPPVDILDSFIKAMLFAIVVSIIHCYYGYRATGGPAGVGVAAGRAIRASIISVVVLNLVLSLIMFGGASSTARLVG